MLRLEENRNTYTKPHGWDSEHRSTYGFHQLKLYLLHVMSFLPRYNIIINKRVIEMLLACTMSSLFYLLD